ncbi:uncharacterized protein RCC_11524 [Ramularia collo-cygni]|uniref:Heterokaryon incompatibility domain-containing protein n=1 Tax=Ramularia collo-cygni TaxID=112498 RepID=A0A2D3VF31_9PEZI|nr:uncharacterized protein RCC_11524 [Ramularia collo-cygni]CZT25855.1 uncharacterized protein RCC_11524 [Ramularia collo-cygni]
MDRFQYDSLVDGQIRLVALQPARSFYEPLYCTLTTVHLEFATYEALSYVWGPSQEQHTLICNRQSLIITSNLNVALRYLRRKREQRVLWIDAVCIDQTNNAEKEIQIQLMGRIYREARACVVWLGESDRDINRLFRALKGPNHFFRYDWARDGLLFGGIEKKWTLYPLLVILGAGTGTIAFKKLRELSWFTRVWTIQELALNASPMAMYGRNTLRWRTLLHFWLSYDAATLIDYNNYNVLMSWTGSRYGLEASHLNWLRSSQTRTSLALKLQLMSHVQAAKVWDLKDKVFGVSAMLEMIGWQPPPPDYARSLEDLYVAASWAWARFFPDLVWIGMATRRHSALDLPSWVIDWSQATGNESAFFTHFLGDWVLNHAFATRHTQPSISNEQEAANFRQLCLKGYVVARVHGCAESVPNLRHSGTAWDGALRDPLVFRDGFVGLRYYIPLGFLSSKLSRIPHESRENFVAWMRLLRSSYPSRETLDKALDSLITLLHPVVLVCLLVWLPVS